jgi:hypothetical protein
MKDWLSADLVPYGAVSASLEDTLVIPTVIIDYDDSL